MGSTTPIPFHSISTYPPSINPPSLQKRKGRREREMEKEEKNKVGGGADDEGGDKGRGARRRGVERAVRVVPMGLCVAAMVVMLKNSEDNDFGSVSSSDLLPFTYLVYADALCAAYSLVSAFFTPSSAPSLPRAWAFFLLDQLLTYVILAAGTVSAEIIYLAYNGDAKVTWSKECGVYGGFCRKATMSVGFTFGAVVCYVVLSLVSSYRLFSTFEAPIPFLSGKGTEIAAFPG